MNTLYVGIDVSSKSNVVYLMLPNGDKHSSFSVANSHEGSTQLLKRILSAFISHSLDTVLIGLEATSVYGDNLVYFLREDATPAPFNRKIHVLNPRQVKKSAIPSVLPPLPSMMNLNPQKHWQIWTYMSSLTSSLKKERIVFLILMQ